MFRRSKIKITPKIPQSKPSERVSDAGKNSSPNVTTNSNCTNEQADCKQQSTTGSESNPSLTINQSCQSPPLQPILSPPPETTATTLPLKDSQPSHQQPSPAPNPLSSSEVASPLPTQPSNSSQETSSTASHVLANSLPPVDIQLSEESSLTVENTSLPEKLPNAIQEPDTLRTSVEATKTSPARKISATQNPVPTTSIVTIDNGAATKTSSTAKSAPTNANPKAKGETEAARPKKRIKLSSKDLIDRTSVTLFHLIHTPIYRSRKSDKKKNATTKSKDATVDENNGTDETDKDANNNNDTGEKDDSSENVPKNEPEESQGSTATEVSDANQREAIGPRVKVGPDGQLILDEESVVIKKPKPVEKPAVEETSGKTTYASFRKRPLTARWSKEETIDFYTALNLIGPDFSLMANLFFKGKRTRTDLKNKFRRENKLNKLVIDKALYEGEVDYCLAQEAVQATSS